jgi:hypothetical protein
MIINIVVNSTAHRQIWQGKMVFDDIPLFCYNSLIATFLKHTLDFVS